MSDARPPDDDLADVDDAPGDPADDPTGDGDLPYVALFAGVPDAEVEDHAAALHELLDPPGGDDAA